MPVSVFDVEIERVAIVDDKPDVRQSFSYPVQDLKLTPVLQTAMMATLKESFKNGILPIKVKQEDLDKLMDDASRGANSKLSVDLEAQEIRGPDGGCIKFDIDPHRKHCLLNGLDDVGLTLQKESAIKTYEDKAKAARPWA